jgi:hypothetical protein
MSPREKLLPGELVVEHLDRKMFGLRGPTTK